MTDVTILIVANKGIVLTLLDSVIKYTNYSYKLKLIVNNPTDDVIGFLSQDKYPYHITHFDDGRYKVWNYGCEVSETEYVCFMPDGGMIVLENWLTNMMKHVDKKSIISPHILTNDKVLYDFWKSFKFKYVKEPFLYHNKDQMKQLAVMIEEEYQEQTDDNTWLRPWLVHRASFQGWCTDEPHPASMDVLTLNALKASSFKLVRALDSGVILFN